MGRRSAVYGGGQRKHLESGRSDTDDGEEELKMVVDRVGRSDNSDDGVFNQR